jgi:hypothetical protein
LLSGSSWPYGASGKQPPATLDAQFSAVREAQRLAPEMIDHTGVIPAIDLELRDGIHISTPGLKRLGARLANTVLRNAYRLEGSPAGPRLDSWRRHASVQWQSGGRVSLTCAGIHSRIPTIPAACNLSAMADANVTQGGTVRSHS